MTEYIQIVVEDVRPPAESNKTPMLVGFGRTLGDDKPIAFTGDQRSMWAIRHALDAEDTLAIAVVEPWQVIVCQADTGCGLPPAPDSIHLWCRGHERLASYNPYQATND